MELFDLCKDCFNKFSIGKISLVFVLFACTSSINSTFAQDSLSSLMELSLVELMSLKVTSASNKSEGLNQAPATIVVITEEDILERGYFELYDVLNDLPGFDLSRAFGDDDYYEYVRGYRKTESGQMLLMVDGIIMNHLYNNNMNGYAQYPLFNIKQIEIVYGPASAIYGPNAFTGVINMITKSDGKSIVTTTTGSNNTNIIDLHINQKLEEIEINVSGRFYQSAGHDFAGRTSMLEDSLFTNPYYWGGFSQAGFTGYNSPANSHFIHPFVRFKGLTVGTINFFNESGLGSEFAGGTALNSGTWQTTDNSFYTKYETKVKNLKSKTLFKIRRSDIPGSSAFFYRSLLQGSDTSLLTPGEQLIMNSVDTFTNTSGSNQTYVTDQNTQYAEYWQANNASLSFYQDFSYKASNKLTVNFGLKYKKRNLNRDYFINSSSYSSNYLYLLSDSTRNNPLNPAVQQAISFPDRPNDSGLDQENHSLQIDRGIYSQVEYVLSGKNTLFAGLRYDHNSVWKSIVSPRIGIVTQTFNNFVGKAFFGTAYLEPSARVLYGGWSGSLSNENLVPEKMRTFEISGRYTKDDFSIGVNTFYNFAPDVISQNEDKVPINLGERRMFGMEANARLLILNESKFLSRVKCNLFVSYINSKEDLTGNNALIETGNMAPIKVKFMLSGKIKNNIHLSLQNRYISSINTVSSNPINTIDANFVSDAFVEYRNILIDGFSIGIKVYNVFNTDYFHPGYRKADAGENGVNQALLNSSWYSSRLPQPKRTVLVTARFMF